VGLQASKSPKSVIFGINLPQRGIFPYAIFTKFGMGRNLQARTLVPNLTTVTFKMWAYTYSPQIAEIGNFWYKFSPKGYTPLSDFYKIWLGE